MINQFLKNFPETKIFLESGRYVVGNAGWFVSCVQQVKQSRGKHFLVTDGGMNCHLMAAGYGAMIQKNFPIFSVTKSNTGQSMKYHITGPLCTPADVIGKNCEIPETDIGDLIVIKESGAYGPTASPVYFLGHGYPAEILIESGIAQLIRERDSVEDLLRKQKHINF